MIVVFILFIIIIAVIVLPPLWFANKQALAEVQASLDVRLDQLKRDFQFRTKELARRLKSDDLAEDEWQDLSDELSSETKTSISLTQKAKQSSTTATSIPLIIFVMVLIALVSALGYRYSGNYELSQTHLAILEQLKNDPKAIDNYTDKVKQKASQEALNDLYLALRSNVDLHPRDASAWRELAMFNSNYGRLKEAKVALKVAIKLQPKNHDLKIALAQLLMQSKDTSDIFLALDVIHKILKSEPKHESALLLLGMSYYQFGMYQKSIATLTTLKSIYTEGSEMSGLIQKRIDSATQKIAERDTAASPHSKQEVVSASLKININIAESIKEKLTGNETVFIFAKAVNGPRFPVAVVKTTLKELTGAVTLSDKNAMQASSALSKFKQVTITVRISTTADVVAKKGDYQGHSQIIDAPFNGAEISLLVSEEI